tara:strand:- start:1708 stop:2298 length:591 start_codon:yes stop_codon:yes gene_type:complete
MTRDAASFDRLYRDRRDPWDYETSAYEADKYLRCLNLLPRRRFGCALEVGCSIGVMSEAIAARCVSLLAIDFAPTAIVRARERGIANARFRVAGVPQDWPRGPWDLIVLSEVLYYLDIDALERTIALVTRDLAPGGSCLVAGYTGQTETRLTAAETQDRLLDSLATARPRHRIRHRRGSTWIAAVFDCRAGQSEGR